MCLLFCELCLTLIGSNTPCLKFLQRELAPFPTPSPLPLLVRGRAVGLSLSQDPIRPPRGFWIGSRAADAVLMIRVSTPAWPL